MGMRTDMSEDSGGVTLAFSLDAFRELADPAAVFGDARQWSRHVGVIAANPSAAEEAIRRHGVRQDYEIGKADPQSLLSRLKWESDTDRYLFIGTDDHDEELAEYVNWEYIHIEDAASKAGWELTADLGRLKRMYLALSQLVPWG